MLHFASAVSTALAVYYRHQLHASRQMQKYCSLVVVASIRSFRFVWLCMCVCVCVSLWCSLVFEWHSQQKEEGGEWDCVCSISCLWSWRQRLTPCYGISFCVSLLIWGFAASRTAPPANQLCNIHLVQRCCCAAAGCQPLLLIAPVSHVEARGSKRKKKAERVSGEFVRQAQHRNNCLKQHDRRLISSDCG